MRFNIRKSGVGFVAALVGSLALSPVGAWAEPTPTYLDNRSTPQSLVASYYNAINQKQYVRAYSYFSHGAAPTGFKAWATGYETTQHVSIKMGDTYPDPGAGQIYWALPVALSVVSTDGPPAVYAGCYHLHLTSVSMQIEPPFVPMSIQSATLKKSSLAFEEAVPSSC
ncbi:MAG: hypothetical protein ACJAXQ_000248 [Parvibaculaceae bacterium]|jgi:hypothetical protein